jgi:hypothetical protein
MWAGLIKINYQKENKNNGLGWAWLPRKSPNKLAKKWKMKSWANN